MFILLVIALVAAGIFTQSAIWYIIAGILAGFMLLVSLVALIGAGAAVKKVNQELKGFDSDFFKENRPSRYRR